MQPTESQVDDAPQVHVIHHGQRFGLVLGLHPLLNGGRAAVHEEGQNQKNFPHARVLGSLGRRAGVLPHEQAHAGHDEEDEEVLLQRVLLVAQQDAEDHHRDRLARLPHNLKTKKNPK